MSGFLKAEDLANIEKSDVKNQLTNAATMVYPLILQRGTLTWTASILKEDFDSLRVLNKQESEGAFYLSKDGEVTTITTTIGQDTTPDTIFLFGRVKKSMPDIIKEIVLLSMNIEEGTTLVAKFVARKQMKIIEEPKSTTLHEDRQNILTERIEYYCTVSMNFLPGVVAKIKERMGK